MNREIFQEGSNEKRGERTEMCPLTSPRMGSEVGDLGHQFFTLKVDGCGLHLTATTGNVLVLNPSAIALCDHKVDCGKFSQEQIDVLVSMRDLESKMVFTVT